VLGAPDLKPETSRNLSLGLVLQPARDVHASIDVYQIDIDNRIVQSASLSGPLALSAIAANGTTIPADVTSDGTSAAFFTNGVDTRTRGIDLSVDWRSDLGDFGWVKWLLNGGYNRTALRRIHDAPAPLAAAGLSLIDPVQNSNLTTATPHIKVGFSGTWIREAWEATLRETYYGNSSQVQGYPPYTPYFTLDSGRAFLTDVDVGYSFWERYRVNIGANNLFNRYPNKIDPSIYQSLNYDQYSHVSPFGINGGYYYLKVSAAL
jgi:iron complex outermembrane receptor protein